MTLSHLNWRAAIKQYDTKKKLSRDQVELLIEAARLAPTSYGIQPIKLYVVSDSEIQKKLQVAGYNQSQFADASHIFIFAARKTVTEADISEYIKRIHTQRKVPLKSLEEYKQIMLGSLSGKTAEELHISAAGQAYIALGVTLDVAALNNIDATPMGGFNPDAVDDILGIASDGFHSVVTMAVGFRSPDDVYSKMKKVRKTRQEFVKEI